jgi:hypothetical protein
MIRDERKGHAQRSSAALDAHGHVLLQSGVRLVDNLIDSEGGSGLLGMFGIVCSKSFRDFSKPIVELLGRASVKGGK